MEPLRPPVEGPVASSMDPLLPDCDDPDCRVMTPDTAPANPVAAVDTDTAPEPELMLDPLVTVTDPPIPAPPTTDPAVTTTPPPAPELLDPTTTLMEPARPPVADPVNTTTAPEFPDLVVPDTREIMPLDPEDDASAVDNNTDPDPELTPEPLCTATEPPMPPCKPAPAVMDTAPPAPVAADESPARTTTAPPGPIFPVPTTMLKDPA
jgi:hypothetical protein